MERLATADLRVATIGHRLLTASVARCSLRMPATGLLLHSLAQYRGEYRKQALASWSFPAPVSIESIVPDSPAARAGIRSGDGLLAIGDRPLPMDLPPGAPTTELRDRAEEELQAASPTAPISLTIRREDRDLVIILTPVAACRSRIEVAPGMKGAARSDGRTIQLGQAFVERVDDDGLAVAIAHELAHTILEHRNQLASLEAAGRSTRPLARQFEDEADLLSLDLLSGAGWDPAIAPRFMRQQGKRYDPALPGLGKHRSAEDRARRMEQHILARQSADCSLNFGLAARRSNRCTVPRFAA
jgi:PDZ domain